MNNRLLEDNLDVLIHLLLLKEVLGSSSFFSPSEQLKISVNYKKCYEKYQFQRFSIHFLSVSLIMSLEK